MPNHLGKAGADPFGKGVGGFASRRRRQPPGRPGPIIGIGLQLGRRFALKDAEIALPQIFHQDRGGLGIDTVSYTHLYR